ncbi:MAG: hypothetical protein IPL49_18540 [Saprospirales bacterium]|nr:hypothetical protein [Saprospirales bacterium]
MKYVLCIAALSLLPVKAFLQIEDTLSLISSNAYALHLEDGRKLWEMGKLRPAETELRAYLEHDPGHLEANTLLAYIYLWNGHTLKAKNLAYWLLEQDPQNARAQRILSEVQTQTIPHLSLNPSWSTDDQPMDTYQVGLETGWYQSWLLAPTLQLRLRQVQTDSAGYTFFQTSLGNQFYLSRTQTRISIHTGLFDSFSIAGKQSLTWGVRLYQPLPAHFSLEVGFEKRPYLNTLQSIQQTLTDRFAQLAIHYNHSDKWLGKAALERQIFPDKNAVQTAYAWLLAPLLDRWSLRLQAGYGYTYANAGENRFRPLNPYDPTLPDATPVEGIYDPYFTPHNQQIHALLAAVQYTHWEKLRISLRGSAGIFATAGIPYFYPNNDGTEYQRDFQTDHYFPFEIHVETEWKINAESKIALTYSVQQFLFYTIHSVGLRYQHYFLP